MARTRTITLQDVEPLAAILHSARAGHHVVRAVEPDGDVLVGATLRGLQDGTGASARHDADPLDLWVRVTTDTGGETRWSVPDMLGALADRSLALDYRN